MTRMSDDGPLLPMHNISPEESSTAAPPPYAPPLDPTFYSRSESPSKPQTISESAKRNRRKACICMGVGIVMFVAVPAAIFGGIISKAHTNCITKTPGNAGSLPDGQKFC